MSPPLYFSEESPEPSASVSFESSESSKPKPWRLYPMDEYEKLMAKHGGKDNVKIIHVVRHAEGTHNVGESYMDHANIDARLTPKGKQQCSALARKVTEILPHLLVHSENYSDIGVVVSPLTRCVQTALYCFPWLANSDDIPWVAHESFRETVNFNCDRRRTISEISAEYQRVDFSLCDKDHDYIWDDYRKRLSKEWDQQMESGELNKVVDRAIEGFKFLQQRPEHQLIVCSHSAFLRCILNWGQEGGVPMLMPQIHDTRQDKTNHKMFDFGGNEKFESEMRESYENCELRTFCMLVNKI